MKTKDFYLRSMRLIYGEADPNFAEFLKAGGGSQSTPDPDLDDDNDDGVDDGQDDNQDDNQDDDGQDNQDDQDDDSSDDKKPNQTIQMLQDQISNLTSLVTSLAGKKEEVVDEPEPEIDIFESEDFTSLAEGMAWDDKETKLMKVFLSKALENNSKQTLKAAMKDLPDIVNTSVTANQTHSEIRKNFFTDHSALAPVKKYVAEIASTIATEYKQIGKKASLQDILNEAAKQSYKNLGIKKAEKQKDGESRGGKPNPAFPKNRSNARKGASKTSKMQNDIQAIMSLDN